MKSPQREPLKLAVSFQSFKAPVCIWQPNKPFSYLKIQMNFLFTKSNYKPDWPRLSPAVFTHKPRVKCCRCDVVFIYLFNTKCWPPRQRFNGIANDDENIIMIKCPVSSNWLQKADLPPQKMKTWMLCCVLMDQHCSYYYSFTYLTQYLTRQSLESYRWSQVVVAEKLLKVIKPELIPISQRLVSSAKRLIRE